MPPPQEPPKLTLTRLDNPALTLVAQFNPTDMSETYGAEWSSIKIPGYSSTRRQFTNTRDATLKFGLRFRSQSGGLVAQKQMLPTRAFLKSCCRPIGFAGSIAVAGAPLVLLVWPSVFSMVVTVDTLTFNYERNDSSNRLVDMLVTVGVTEFSYKLVTADDFEEGTDYT